MHLNNKYFKLIYHKVDNNINYDIIHPIGCPMILLSKKDKIPLASLHFNVVNKECKSLITKNENDFQGLINKDNQEFEFVISNLTSHRINFNIIKENYKNLNRINILSSHQSYVVRCNKETNATLVLNAIKKIDPKDGTEKKITVSQSEKSKLEEDKGTYYNISVVPENIENFKELFVDAEWQCVDLFYMKYPTTNHNANHYDIFNTDRILPQEANDDWFDMNRYLPQEINDDWFDIQPEPLSVKNRNLIDITKPIGINTIGTSLRNASCDIRGSPSVPKFVINPWLNSNSSSSSSLESDTNFKLETPNINKDIIKNSFVGKVGAGKIINEDSTHVKINLA